MELKRLGVGFLCGMMFAGCASTPNEDELAGAASAQKAAARPSGGEDAEGSDVDDSEPDEADPESSSCGNYERKQCDPQRVIDYIKSKDVSDTLNTALGCT